jgi:nucleoside 2-deoxyribosyltransferase
VAQGRNALVKIYLAGPLFTKGERLFNRFLAEHLTRPLHHEIWLPQDKEPRGVTPGQVGWERAVFNLDVQGLDWADVIVANLDGPDADSGTSWEMGYAYAKGKPVVIYRTDFRKAGESDGPYNIMLGESAHAWIDCNSLSYEIIDVAILINDVLATIQPQRTAGESSVKS